jgi:putative hydrolase of the HAD superfamily
MTFLFDIGNVLLDLHFERFYSAVLGRSDGELPEALVALTVPYETGWIDDAEFIARCLSGLPGPLSSASFSAAWQAIFSLNEPMASVVHQLKSQGHRLILFSNTNPLHSSYFLNEFAVFQCFDAHHFSYAVKSMKPSPEFYASAIKHFDLDPEETIYIDDLQENIAAGLSFGFRCWHYRADQHAACLRWLAGQGLIVVRGF